jgi:hypothetical protein
MERLFTGWALGGESMEGVGYELSTTEWQERGGHSVSAWRKSGAAR